MQVRLQDFSPAGDREAKLHASMHILGGNHTPDASLLVIKKGTVSPFFLLVSLVLASTK